MFALGRGAKRGAAGQPQTRPFPAFADRASVLLTNLMDFFFSLSNIL